MGNMYRMQVEDLDVASPAMEGSFEAAVFASTAWQAGGAKAAEHPEAAQVDSTLNFKLIDGSGIRDVSDDLQTLEALEMRRVRLEESNADAGDLPEPEGGEFWAVQQSSSKDEL